MVAVSDGGVSLPEVLTKPVAAAAYRRVTYSLHACMTSARPSTTGRSNGTHEASMVRRTGGGTAAGTIVLPTGLTRFACLLSFGRRISQRPNEGPIPPPLSVQGEASLAPAHVLERFGALLEVMDLNQYSIAAAQPGLSVDRVLNLWAPVPPADEQALMSEDLVERSREMEDALVTTNRQIALLKEYRTRLIADVVTGKLDVREASADLPETDPLTGDRNRADAIPTESSLHSTAPDMTREANA